MALPEVKFQVVAAGVPESIRALKSLEQALRDHEAQMISIKRQSISKLQSENQRAYARELEDLKRHVSSMNQVRQGAMSPNMGGNFGMGSRFTMGGSNIGASMGGGGGLIGGAIQASKDVPLSPMWMLEKWKSAFDSGAELIKQGIQTVFDALKFGATEIAGAMLDLGQARGIKESIVSAGHAETLAAQNVFESAPSERGGLSPVSNLKNLQEMSEGTTFVTEEIAKAQQAWIRYNGNLNQFNDNWNLINKLSLSLGLSIEDTSRSMAQLRTEFQGMTELQFQQTMAGLLGESRKGGIPAPEIGTMSKALGIGPMIGGDPVKTAIFTGAVLQGVAPAFKRGGSQMGGGAGASTAFADVFENINKRWKEGKDPGLGAIVAGGKIMNPEDVIANLAVESRKKGGTKLTKPEQLLGSVLAGQTGLGEGATDEQVKAAVKNNIEAMEKNAFTTRELNDNYEELMGMIQNRLKVAFVELSNYIGKTLLPWIESNLMPTFEKIKGWLEKNSEKFGKLYDDVSKATSAIADLAEKLGHVLLEIAKTFYKYLVSPMIDGALLYIETLGKIISKVPGAGGIGKDIVDIATGIRGGKKDIEGILSTPFGGPGKKELDKEVRTAEFQTVHISEKSTKSLAKEIHNNMNVHNPFRRHWEPIGSGRTGS